MFVAREIKQTLLRKFGKVFFDSPYIDTAQFKSCSKAEHYIYQTWE